MTATYSQALLRLQTRNFWTSSQEKLRRTAGFEVLP